MSTPAITSFRGNYFFLSNFCPCRVKIEDILYPSAEHAFQAMKSFKLDDRINVAKLKTPAEAKHYGRNVTLRPDWEAVKTGIMHVVVHRKFFDNENLGELLLATKDAYLEEGNTWGDDFWGTVNGQGKNWLGKILMTVRTDLLKQRAEYVLTQEYVS